MTESLSDRVEAIFWRRHSHPRSGWSRISTGPLLFYAVYRRNWRLLLTGLAWAVLNLFLFSPPESEDTWMTRAVLSERWWVREEGNRTIGLSYPNICNTAGALAFIYTLYAAWQLRPGGTTLIDPDVEVQTAVERPTSFEGAAAGVRDYVGKTEIDLVVMGSHGRSNLKLQLLGSVASTVLRSIDVPLLVVKRTA